MIDPADILVVDDSPTVRRMVELVLARRGHRVHASADGAAGLETARSVHPDLILVDYVMPNMNGVEFCHHAGRDPNLRDIPIILISSKGETVGQAFEKRFGVVESFTKPFEPDELVSKIESLLPKSAPPAEGVAVPVAEVAEVSGTVTFPLDDAVDRLDRLVRGYFDSALPSLLKGLLADTLRQQGVVPPGPMSMTGQIGAFALPDVLNFLASTSATGRLSIISKVAFAEIFLEDGLFAFATVSRKEGRRRVLSDVLEDMGVPLDPAVLLEVVAESQEGGRRMGELLIERQLANKDQVSDALRAQAQESLQAALEITEGEFSFDHQPLSRLFDGVDFRIPMMHVLMDSLRMLDERHLAAQRFPDDDIVLNRFIANEYAGDIALEGRELTVFLAIDGKKTLRELSAELGCSPLEFKQICGPLVQAGMVRVPQQARRAQAATPAADKRS